MSDSRYLQTEIEKKFDHLAEECGEFVAAYGKMRRWGAFSYNPELPEDERTLNIDQVTIEINDIQNAICRIFENTPITNEQLEEAFPLYND